MNRIYIRRRRGFTLVELMTVVVVILTLSAICLSVAGFVQKKMALSTTRAQIAQIELALDTYKADYGYYPKSCTGRISKYGMAEGANGQLLYNALFLQGKKYLRGFPENQIRCRTSGSTNSVVQTNLCDVWGSPFNYYCSPATVATNIPAEICACASGISYGGQVNRATYDLFSYGPDQTTYVRGAWYWAPINNPPWLITFTNAVSAVDDITNWN